MKLTKEQLEKLVQQEAKKQLNEQFSNSSFYTNRTATQIAKDISDLERIFQYVKNGIQEDGFAPENETLDSIDKTKKILKNLKKLIR